MSDFMEMQELGTDVFSVSLDDIPSKDEYDSRCHEAKSWVNSKDYIEFCKERTEKLKTFYLQRAITLIAKRLNEEDKEHLNYVHDAPITVKCYGARDEDVQELIENLENKGYDVKYLRNEEQQLEISLK